MEAGQHKQREEKRDSWAHRKWKIPLRYKITCVLISLWWTILTYRARFSVQSDTSPPTCFWSSGVLNTHPTLPCTPKLPVSVYREILKTPPTFRHKDTMDKIGLAPVVFVIRHRMSQHCDVTVLFHFSAHGRVVPVLYLHTRNSRRTYRGRPERY